MKKERFQPVAYHFSDSPLHDRKIYRLDMGRTFETLADIVQALELDKGKVRALHHGTDMSWISADYGGCNLTIECINVETYQHKHMPPIMNVHTFMQAIA